MKRTTVKSLAEMLGVSAKTISKALNDQPGVSEELRTQIKEKAKELNYVPNIFGRGLQGKCSKTIGVIIGDNTNPNNSYHIKGIESKAANAGYNIILCNSSEDIRLEEKYIKVLIERQVDGIIIVPSPTPNGEKHVGIELLNEFGIPYMLMNRTIEGDEHSFVKSDSIYGGYLAVKYLIDKGHKSIVHLTTNEFTSPVQERLKVFKQTMQEYGLLNENSIYTCEHATMEDGYEATLKLLREHYNFTAIFAYNDILALGAMKAVHDCRLRIPTDVAIIGYDNIPFSSISMVPLTTVQQDSYLIGTTSMEIMLKEIQNPKQPLSKIVFKPSIVERESV